MNVICSSRFSNILSGLVKTVAFLLILLIGSLIVIATSRYLNPDETGGYLASRTLDTISLIRFTVLVHALVSFVLLLTSGTLIFLRLEQKYSTAHRLAGKFTVFLTILVVVPTGFVLSYHALGGLDGKLIFALLTLLTLLFISFGFYNAMKRRFDLHKKWMLRFFVLLTSAIWLRINLFICFQVKWVITENDYLWCAVLSWVPQLLLLELFFWLSSRKVKT